MALERMGHRVCWAAHGEGAIDLLRTELPDVMLLDLNLGPGIDGWEVARRKTSVREIAHIPIIVITGEPIESIHRRSDNPLSGALLLMSKPTDLDRLEKTLNLINRS